MGYFFINMPASALTTGLLLWWLHMLRQRFQPGALRAAREKLGLSQEHLADKIGVDVRTLRRWEHGERLPHLKNLVALRKMSLQPQGLTVLRPLEQCCAVRRGGSTVLVTDDGFCYNLHVAEDFSALQLRLGFR